jgi:hypothetical protein
VDITISTVILPESASVGVALVGAALVGAASVGVAVALVGAASVGVGDGELRSAKKSSCSAAELSRTERFFGPR